MQGSAEPCIGLSGGASRLLRCCERVVLPRKWSAVRVKTNENPYVFMMTLLTRMSPTLLPTEPTIQPATATADGGDEKAALAELDDDEVADDMGGRERQTNDEEVWQEAQRLRQTGARSS